MRITVIFLIASFLNTSCWNNDKEEDFYNYSRISYIYRLPVIKPYEITSPDNGKNWAIAFKNSPPPVHGVQFLTNIGIQDSVFIVYSSEDLSVPGHPQVWAVIDVVKKEVHLKNKGLEDIRLYEINTVFETFDKNKKLPHE